MEMQRKRSVAIALNKISIAGKQNNFNL